MSATANVQDVRVQGANRYETSVATSTAAAALPGAPATMNTHFVLASGGDFADALSAAALAGHLGSTILLVPPSGDLSATTKARIAGATHFYIVGGTSALPGTLEAALLAEAPTASVQRLAGGDRYETASAVAQWIGAGSIGIVDAKRTAILVSGTNFADAVSASPAAYRGPAAQARVHPILLTRPDSLSSSTAARLQTLNVQQVIIVGGESAVSADVADSVSALGINVVRVGGATRFETAANFANLLITPEAAGGFGWNATNVGLANLSPAGGGADALSAAPYLGFAQAPVLGVASLPPATAAWLDANKAAVATLHVFGGSAAISADTVNAARTAAGGQAAPTATILARESTTAPTTTLVTFSEPVTTATATTIANYAFIPPAGVGAVNPVLVTHVMGNSYAVTFGVAVPPGSTIRVVGGVIATADGRTVSQTDLVVAADTTAPVATVSALVGTAGGTQNVFRVTFNEPVTRTAGGNLAAADFTINGVNVGAIGAPVYTLFGNAATNAEFDAATITVTTPVALVAGQTVGIKAGVVSDLTAAQNVNAAASTTVAADAVKPTVVGNPTYQLTKINAFAQFGAGAAAVNVVADKATTSGLPGNAVTVELAVAGNSTPLTVGVAGYAITVNVATDGGGVPTSTAAQVAAAINAHAGASALVTASFGSTGTGLVAAVGATNLAGGAESLAININFSEGLSVLTAGDVTYNSGAASLTNGVVTPALTPGNTSATLVFTLSNVDQRPTPNVATIAVAADGFRDLAGNGNAAVAPRLIVAG